MLTPQVIYLETVNYCNANCIMCPHKYMLRHKNIMSQQLFEVAVQSIGQIDLNKISLFMHKEGEPLLDPNITERIKYAKKELVGLKELGMNTNAMLLTPKLSEELLDSGLDTIYFSVDGASPETYNKIRVNLDYNVVEANLKSFFALRRQRKSKIRVIMQMLTNNENYHEISAFKEKWQDEECEFYIKQMHCYLDGEHSSFVQHEKIKQLHVCQDPFRIMVIYVSGDIGVCCWDYNNEYKIGNINDNTLLGIFNNSPFNYLREKQLKKECKNIIPCNRCMRIFGNDTIVEFT